MAFRFEFDPANRILLGRFEGRLTDESLAEYYRAVRKYSTATDARASISEFSSASELALSSEFLHELANQEPAMPDGFMRPRFIVAPTAVGFGLARMFQIEGEHTRPLLEVVHTMDEALAALGIQSPHFEPLE
jgi:hypothetical protein